MRIKNPFELLKKTYLNISGQVKAAFISAFAAGLAAHLYQFTNKLFNFDELYNTPEGTGEGLALGRFGLFYVGRLVKHFFGNYSLPLVNGLVSLLLIGIAACLIVKGLEIQNSLYAALIGGIMAVFPSVTCNFFFLFTSPYYSLALMLACLSAYLVLKKQTVLTFLISVFLLAFSTGIYQAYFAVSAAFVVSGLILLAQKRLSWPAETEADKNDYSDILKKAFFFLFFLLAALISYLVINKVSVAIFQVELPDYQGLSSIGTVDPVFIIKRAAETYAHTIHLFTENVYSLNPTSVIRISIFLLFLVSCYLLLSAFGNGIRAKHSIMLLIMSAVFLLAFPLSLFLVSLMVRPDTYIQAAMLNSAVFALILPIALADHFKPSDKEREALTNLSHWLVLTGGCAVILVYIWYANGNYMALQYADYHDLAYYTVMLSQIKDVEGFTDDTPVIILGQDFTDNSFTAGNLVHDTFYLYGTSPTYISAYSSKNLFTKYLGYTPEFLFSDEEEEYFNSHPKVREMPCYPDQGSIRMIEDVIVVKVEEAKK